MLTAGSLNSKFNSMSWCEPPPAYHRVGLPDLVFFPLNPAVFFPLSCFFFCSHQLLEDGGYEATKINVGVEGEWHSEDTFAEEKLSADD